MEWDEIRIQTPRKKLLTAREVAECVGVDSYKTIERWSADGIFPPSTTRGREKVWSNLAVTAWLLWKTVCPGVVDPKEKGDESE